MNFSLPSTINILQRTPSLLVTMLKDLPEEWTNTNEGADTWSVYDIIGHLIHGELTDWIPRTKIILSDAVDKTFPVFDRFAQFEASKEKSLTELLQEFKQLRENNLAYLKSLSLTEDQLDKTGLHPAFGEVTLRQLLATWAVHDLNHINQITRVMAKQYATAVGRWIQYLGVLKK